MFIYIILLLFFPNLSVGSDFFSLFLGGSHFRNPTYNSTPIARNSFTTFSLFFRWLSVPNPYNIIYSNCTKIFHNIFTFFCSCRTDYDYCPTPLKRAYTLSNIRKFSTFPNKIDRKLFGFLVFFVILCNINSSPEATATLALLFGSSKKKWHFRTTLFLFFYRLLLFKEFVIGLLAFFHC